MSLHRPSSGSVRRSVLLLALLAPGLMSGWGDSSQDTAGRRVDVSAPPSDLGTSVTPPVQGEPRIDSSALAEAESLFDSSEWPRASHARDSRNLGVAPSPLEAHDREESLRSLNPSLSAHDRHRIGQAIDRFSRQYELDPDLVMAIMLVESDARPWAISAKGAVGLMQIMPHMMSPLGLAGNAATIESNIEAGCVILADNIRRLGLERGISAYFWGSKIRGVNYLEKVLEARERVRSLSNLDWRATAS